MCGLLLVAVHVYAKSAFNSFEDKILYKNCYSIIIIIFYFRLSMCLAHLLVVVGESNNQYGERQDEEGPVIQLFANLFLLEMQQKHSLLLWAHTLH